jgi:hypothetical protein
MPPSKPGNPSDQEATGQEEGESKPNPKRASAATLIDAFARQYERDKEATRKSEKHRTFREYLTIGGLFLAAVVAGFQWSELRSTDYHIGEQAKISAVQLNVMQADQRAWVHMTPTISSNLTFKRNDGARVWVHFNLKNPGRLPAYGTTVAAALIVPTIEEPGYLNTQKRICAEASHENSADSIVLFPGQDFSKELQVAVEDWRIAATMRRAKSDIPLILFYLVGCLDYRLTPDGPHHQTGFGYSLVQKTPNTNDACCNVDLRDVPIEADKIRLAPLTVGEVWFAN